MNRAEEAQSIIDNFKPPEKLHKHVLLIREGGTYTFLNIVEWDKDVDSVDYLNRYQEGAIVDGVSPKISEYHQEDVRYRLNPLQESYDLVHSKTKEGRVFKKLNERHFFYNSEYFKALKGNMALIYPDSLTFIEGNKFVYDGKSIKVKINKNDVFDTLTKVGLFCESSSKSKIYRGSIMFNDNGESSVGSFCYNDLCCYSFCSCRISCS